VQNKRVRHARRPQRGGKNKKTSPQRAESITGALCRERRLHPTRDADDGRIDDRRYWVRMKKGKRT
jgi:hypothetical protein